MFSVDNFIFTLLDVGEQEAQMCSTGLCSSLQSAFFLSTSHMCTSGLDPIHVDDAVKGIADC